jgi:hypothetical protein
MPLHREGLAHEFDADPPTHLASIWAREWEFWSFHSPEWWRRHWSRTGLVDIEVADRVADGWRHWANWDEASLEVGFVSDEFAVGLPDWIATLRSDAGRNLGFPQVSRSPSSLGHLGRETLPSPVCPTERHRICRARPQAGGTSANKDGRLVSLRCYALGVATLKKVTLLLVFGSG